MKKMKIMEMKIDAVANRRYLEANERRDNYDLEKSESRDAKRYQAIIQEASEEMDSKMEEIDALVRNSEEGWKDIPARQWRMEITQDEEDKDDTKASMHQSEVDGDDNKDTQSGVMEESKNEQDSAKGDE